MRMRTWGAAGLLLLFGTDVSAMDLQLQAISTATISVPTGQGRILVLFSGLTQLTDEWVTDATLEVALADAAKWDIPVEADLLTTSWGPGATWASPWQNAGGDRDRSLATTGIVQAGSAVLRVDVTDLVRAIVEGGIGDHGFILAPANPAKIGFGGEELTLLSANAQAAQLTVHYRRITGLGHEGGPNALVARKRTARAQLTTDRPAAP